MLQKILDPNSSADIPTIEAVLTKFSLNRFLSVFGFTFLTEWPQDLYFLGFDPFETEKLFFEGVV